VVIVGVKFKSTGKIYYFDPGDFTFEDLPLGTPVIVETGRGIEFGILALRHKDVDEKKIVMPLRRLIRLATGDDQKQEDDNRIRELEAKTICEEKAAFHGLNMHLVNAEFTFDHSKVVFFFTADGRVDFRELVKDLAATFRTRIELRQIGVRDEARMISGIGICGRTLCCASFLDDFLPVSIKSAKDQGLSLNPSKISGLCGKLMCCLKYEEETYLELMKDMPGVGDIVQTTLGNGEVISINILKQTARVAEKVKGQDAPEINVYPASDLTIIERRPQCEHGYGYEKH